jgi:hypothetical protein
LELSNARRYQIAFHRELNPATRTNTIRRLKASNAAETILFWQRGVLPTLSRWWQSTGYVNRTGASSAERNKRWSPLAIRIAADACLLARVKGLLRQTRSGSADTAETLQRTFSWYLENASNRVLSA